jgi:small subunit ribosomal protein S10
MNKQSQKIRIKIHAFDTKTLNECCEKIIGAVQQTNSIIKGPIPLPTKRRIYCVLRSPHTDKDSREHFEIRVHKKILDIETTSNAAFLKLQMPTGAFFDITYIE